MNIDKQRMPTRLLWVDLEMTGLDPTKHVILEIAAVVTDFTFKEVAQYEAIIQHTDAVLDGADPWPKAQHASSGLTERVRRQGRPEKEVVQEFTDFIRGHFGDEPAILAGNSIHKDRSFIQKWWPAVDALLHYRMLDVSSLKVYMQGRYGLEYPKEDIHRARDDIQASMAEWKYYMQWLQEHEA
jgi:oligoribonuclease